MSDHTESVHVEKLSVYLGIFGSLLAMTALTVWVAFQDFGPLNNLLAVGIAVFKASLVVLFFMHLRHSTRLTKLVIVSSVVWLLILFAFALSDYLTRLMLPYPGK